MRPHDPISPGDGPPVRPSSARPLAWLHQHAAFAALTAMAAASIGLRAFLAGKVNGPFVFNDELGYERMANNFAHGGHLGVFGNSGLVLSPLYPIVLSPVYALTSSAHVAYDWAKTENAVLMSLSVFPTYGIARYVLSRSRSVVVAGLSLLAPLMFYTGLEMSENLAYPLFLVAVWAMLRALRRPSARNDALLLASILLASAARLQHLALFPAALSAVLLLALVQPAPGERRLAAGGRAIRRHWLLFGTVLALAAAILIRRAENGGALPLAGFYANVGRAHASPIAVLESAIYHLAELDWAMGVIPFAGALLAAYLLVRSGFRRNELLFGAVAVAVTAWVLVEVAFNDAAFTFGNGDLERIHERYLIYLVPFFLIALVAALQRTRRDVPTPVHVAIATTAALLPAVIPYASFVNNAMGEASFGLQVFGKNVSGNRIVPVAHPVVFAVVGGAFLALFYLYAVLRVRPGVAIMMTAYAFLILSSMEGLRMMGSASAIATGDPLARVSWVDRAVGANANVVLVEGEGARFYGVIGTAFENLSISRTYYTCRSTFGSNLGEQRLTIGSEGTLRNVDGPVKVRYAVVPPSLHVRGRVVTRRGGLLLIAPTKGVLTVRSGHRAALHCGS